MFLGCFLGCGILGYFRVFSVVLGLIGNLSCVIDEFCVVFGAYFGVFGVFGCVLELFGCFP